MEDPTKIENIREGVYVKIRVFSNPNEFSEDIVHRVISQNDDKEGIIVVLKNGKKGHTINIINSPEIIKKRILAETQNSENKETVFDDSDNIGIWIPLTIQSFLNANGGYLYVGVKDDAPTIDEKLVGLEYDYKKIEEKLLKRNELEPGSKLSEGKFIDELGMMIIDVLEKFLVSDYPIMSAVEGPLIDFDFPVINDVTILEVNVKQSPEPFFFKHISKKNKEIEFDIFLKNERIYGRRLDEFYYREGGQKERIHTFHDFYRYYKNRFKKS